MKVGEAGIAVVFFGVQDPVFVIKDLHIGKNYVIHVYKENAMKETHPEGSDRNTASPTESAVCERRGWEHSGADCLNPALRWEYAQHMTGLS